MKAFGEVKLTTKEVDLLADQMIIDLKKDKLVATGDVVSKDKTGEFKGNKLEYNLKQEEGIFIDSEGIIIDDSLQSPLYMDSPKTYYGKSKTKLTSPQFTTCSLQHSHQHFRAANMVIKPDDKIIAYHVTFWEFNGVVPLFYTPIWIYSLKDNQNRLQTEFGRNEQKGWFVRNTYNYYLSNDLNADWLSPLEDKFGQLYLDYFSNLGFSGGFKHYYRTLKSDHGYLYLYLEQDKRNPRPSPWITAELNREINKSNLDRSYNLKYKDHDSGYLSYPQEINWWSFDYDQTFSGDSWERNWDVNYKKEETTHNDLDLKFDLDRTDWEQNELGFDLDYSLTDEKDSRTDDYRTKLDYKKYLTEDLYVDYNYDYNYQQDSYTDQETEKSWDYDTDLTLGEEKQIYDWSLKTEFERNKEKIKSYNLPQAELTVYPGEVWDYELLEPLDITLGGLNRYHYSWYQDKQNPTFKRTLKYQKEHRYYKLIYDDRQDLIWGNTLDYKEEFQQNLYIGKYMQWSSDSELSLITDLPSNWENELTYNYRTNQGIVPEGFEKEKPKKKIKEELSWRQGKSEFDLNTGYDFLTQKYDLLKGSLNYNFNQHYETDLIGQYDLNKNKFEKFESSLIITYNNFEYNTTAEWDLNNGQPITWDNSLDWRFGRNKWEWHIKAEGDYDYEQDKFTTANLKLAKEMHCRKLVVSYDQVKKEVWLQYQIMAFPQNKANVGVKEGEGVLFGGEIGRLMDEKN